MRASFIYRFNISKVIYPTIAEGMVENGYLNLISGERLRAEFLSGESELAKRINNHIDNGELIPKELWVPFLTSLWDNQKHNVYCGLASNVEQFKLLESHFIKEGVILQKILYLRVNDVRKLVSLAVERYGKLYSDNTDSLVKKVSEYNGRISDILQDADNGWDVEMLDFFDLNYKI